jgi:tetratricopeptide (TPR) repeat protein
MEASVRGGHRERLTDLYFAGLFMHNQLLFQRGRLDQALAAMEETYRLAVKAGHRTEQAGSTGLIAWMHLELEKYAEANELAARFFELARPLGNVGGTRTAAAVLVLARAALREPAPTGAGELLEMEGLNPSDLAIRSHLVSEALIAIGDLRRAQQLADLGYRHAGGRLRELWATLALGEVQGALGPAARKEAEEWIRRASALANEIGSRWGVAATSLATARASLERGDRSAAEAAGDRALSVAREIGFTRLAGRVERTLDEVRDGAGGGLRAASSAD